MNINEKETLLKICIDSLSDTTWSQKIQDTYVDFLKNVSRLINFLKIIFLLGMIVLTVFLIKDNKNMEAIFSSIITCFSSILDCFFKFGDIKKIGVIKKNQMIYGF